MIQINVFSVVMFCIFNVMNCINVSVYFYLVIVQCNSWQIFQFSKFCFFRSYLFLNSVYFINNFVGWIDVNLIIYGIQNQIVVIFYLRGDVIGIYDSRQFQRMCYDRGVGSTVICVGDEIQYFFQVQLCGFGWCQVSGNQNDFILNGVQVDNFQVQDVVQQVFIDIMYVSCMFFQVFIIQFFQGRSLIFDNFMSSCVSCYVFIFNQGYDFLFQFFIFEQYNMFFKDGFFFFIECFISFCFDCFQLG